MKLSIQDLLTKKITQIWVVNNTKGTARSQIVFTVPKIGGNGLDTVLVPATFIPVDVTTMVSHKQLVDASEFRRAVAKGLLTIIDNEEAQRMLSGPGAQKEAERLNAVSANIQNMVNGTIQQEQPSDSSDVAVGVVVAMDSLGTEGSEAVLNSLRSMGELEPRDYQYVLDNAGGDDQLTEFANEGLGV